MSDHVCKKCGEEFTVPFGLEPTDYCNQCAQELVARLEGDLREFKNALMDVIDWEWFPHRPNNFTEDRYREIERLYNQIRAERDMKGGHQ